MQLRFRSSITLELTLLVLIGTGAVLVFVLVYSEVFSRRIILRNAETSAQHLALSVEGELDQELGSVAKVTRNLALALEQGGWDEAGLNGLLRRVVEDNPEIFGAAVAFEPYAFRSDLMAYAPYFCRSEFGVKYVQLGVSSYDYFSRDWYRIARESLSPMWTSPYYDEGGGDVLMTTYSCPFFDDKYREDPPKLIGIITADMSLARLKRMVSSVRVGKTGYAFLVSANGTFLVHPTKRLILRESMLSMAEKAGESELLELGVQITRQKSAFVDIRKALTGVDSFLAFARLPSTGWVLGILYPKSELFAELAGLNRVIKFLAAAGVALLLVVSFLAARSVTGPLRRMARATRKVAAGDLNIDLSDIRRHDEVGDLARDFTGMADDLKKYIKDLTETTAAKQRIESELSIAAEIQRSMLRSKFPAFPDRDDFDIYAVMKPAKEVGGDFYDFFLLDDDHLCVAAGDVSGKGVPAALFMSVAKYLVEAAVRGGQSPDQALRVVNDHLAENNDSCMFVTIFLGILNLRTGELLFANAGHNPPLILAPDRESAFMGPPGGPVLGIIAKADFAMDRLILERGTVLLIYTDGVTEAFSASGEAFSDEKLRDAVVRLRLKPVREITDALLDAIETFAKGAAQADDITIVALSLRQLPTS